MEKEFNPLSLENQLCFPLYAASRKIIQHYTPLLKPLHLTYTQYLVMMVLWEHPKISVGDLCKKLYLDCGTLSPVLKKMEQSGLLQRNRDLNDERSVIVSITEEGVSLRKEALKVPNALSSELMLTESEAKSLYLLLYKILESPFSLNE